MEFHEWKYSEYESIPPQGGFYILFLNKDLTKIYKSDPKGILYIGEASDLNRRLRIFKKTKEWRKGYEKRVDEMFDHSTLTFSVDFDENYCLVPHRPLIDNGLLRETDSLILKYSISRSHKKDEERLLNGHIMLFGQLPPFNNQGSSLKTVWNAENEIWEDSMNFFNEVCGYL